MGARNMPNVIISHAYSPKGLVKTDQFQVSAAASSPTAICEDVQDECESYSGLCLMSNRESHVDAAKVIDRTLLRRWWHDIAQ